MKGLLTFALALCLLIPFTACRSQQAEDRTQKVSNNTGKIAPVSNLEARAQPKLVVGIVIDQFRPDYLERYYPQFSDGGFKRILSEGFNNRNTHYNYVPTVTGPGHASVYSGTTPAVHGVVGNGWYSRELGRSVYCAEDTLARPVGSNEGGHISSRNLLSTTIADELKLATNGEAKVVGIAVKDRGAAFPAGHMPNGAYWFDKKYGKFISSTYFMDELPQWVDDFNALRLPQQYMDSTWSPLLALSAYENPDETPYERIMKGKESATFPYNLAELRDANGNYDLITYTPFANSIVTEMAKAAVKSEALGGDEIPDLLAVSYSSTDILGHSFGPRSVEVQDMYLRLDRDIEELLRYLDAEVGLGEYMVFITADHAAAEVPQYLTDKNVPAGYFSQRAIQEEVSAYLKATFGVEELVEASTNLQFYLNHQKINENKLKLEEVQENLAAHLRDLAGVAAVYTSKQIREQGYSDGVAGKLQKGYYYKRSGDVFLVLDPGWMDYGSYGTTHGSSYNYDTHVPLLWYGWGIKKGESAKKQSITDIAPTLSFLLHIGLPNGATGEPVRELLRD